jgi:hypothetical protein
MKMYHSKVNYYVGIDNDYEGLFGAIDSATVRYNKNKNQYPGFTQMVFIQADGGLQLNVEQQEKKLTNMTPDNKKLITTIFDKNRKFNIISSQFSIHYLFDSYSTINNIIYNITNFLEIDGYFICTLFDPVQIMNLLNGQDIYTSWYTDSDGQRKKFFEIIKKFEGDLKDEPGQSIDVFMGWISVDNTYLTEYMVTKKVLIKTLEKTGCILVDTDLFLNIYNMNKDWFLNVINHEENPKNKKFYKTVAEFYGNLKGTDKESKIWNDLYRFYVFKKINK